MVKFDVGTQKSRKNMFVINKNNSESKIDYPVLNFPKGSNPSSHILSFSFGWILFDFRIVFIKLSIKCESISDDGKMYLLKDHNKLKFCY